MSTKARLMVTTWHPKDEDREFWARQRHPDVRRVHLEPRL